MYFTFLGKSKSLQNVNYTPPSARRDQAGGRGSLSLFWAVCSANIKNRTNTRQGRTAAGSARRPAADRQGAICPACAALFLVIIINRLLGCFSSRFRSSYVHHTKQHTIPTTQITIRHKPPKNRLIKPYNPHQSNQYRHTTKTAKRRQQPLKCHIQASTRRTFPRRDWYKSLYNNIYNFIQK